MTNVKKIRLSDLIQLKKNPNLGSERGNALLETSFEKGGAGRSILIANNGEILAGNHATEVYGQLFDEQEVLVIETDGKQLVAVKRTDIPDSDDERAKALIIGDNRTSDFHEYDADVIADMLESDKDLLNSFFFENELDELLSSLTPDTPAETEESEQSINRADEFQQKWVVQRGDLYQVGKHRIMCGDSTDKNDVARLMDGIKADLLLTDPPYGVDRDKGFGGAGGFAGDGAPIQRRQYDDEWDSERPDQATFILMLENAKTAIIFGGNFFADILPQSKHWIVWDKLNTMPTFGDCELAWTNLKRTSVKKITFEYNGLIGREKERFHPTQKPIGLFQSILAEYSEQGHIILDVFLGSGTTLVACQQTNRIGYGMELHPPYVAVCLERLSNLGLDVKKL